MGVVPFTRETHLIVQKAAFGSRRWVGGGAGGGWAVGRGENPLENIELGEGVRPTALREVFPLEQWNWGG